MPRPSAPEPDQATFRRRRRHRRLLGRARLGPPLSALSRAVHARHDLADTVTVLGPARSGSTWVQEVLAGGRRTCPVFEPLHPSGLTAPLGLPAYPAVAPAASAPDLEQFLATAMRGGVLTPWTLRLSSIPEALTARRFVVKHVQLCLAAGWLGRTFPTSPIVAIVRHPCAVVESMLAFGWDATPADYLAWVSPEEAHQIGELVDPDGPESGFYAAAWAVKVRALLDQTRPPGTHLLVYEDAVADPVGTFGRLLEELRLPRPPDLVERSARPSAVTGAGSVLREGGDPVSGWVDRLTVADRDAVLAVVARAGVAGYGADPRPDGAALAEQHGRPPVG